MLRRPIAAACALLAASCSIETVPLPANLAESVPLVDPCANATRETVGPECFRPNREEHARVGLLCDLHRGQVLLPDTVRISYGFVSSMACGEIPGVCVNSHLEWPGGCVVGKPFTEVAYCPECRRARSEWEREHSSR